MGAPEIDRERPISCPKDLWGQHLRVTQKRGKKIMLKGEDGSMWAFEGSFQKIRPAKGSYESESESESVEESQDNHHQQKASTGNEPTISVSNQATGILELQNHI